MDKTDAEVPRKIVAHILLLLVGALALLTLAWLVNDSPTSHANTGLEGDIEPRPPIAKGDCSVDVFDLYSVLFRWAHEPGDPVYDSYYDLEGSPSPDGDIDALDGQYVAGRFGSTCSNPVPSAPSPTPQSINVSVSPASVAVTAGQQVDVTVSVSNMNAIGAYDVALNHSAALLSYDGFTPSLGAALAGFQCFDGFWGQLPRIACNINQAVDLNNSISGSGTLFTLHFTANASGAAAFSLQGARFGDKWGQQVYSTGSLPTYPDAATYEELAAHWAPVIYQDTDSSCAPADYITNVDYDNEWDTTNNWNDLGSCTSSTSNLSAHVYYWVVETEQNWYIGYSFYHPRDWGEYVCPPEKVQQLSALECDTQVTSPSCPPLPPGQAHILDLYACHENDFEGITLVVQKDGSPYGQFLLMGTIFHSDFRWYKDDDHSPSSDISGFDFNDDCDIDPLTTCSDVDFEVNQPIAYSQAKTHAVIGSQEWEADGFPGGDGIVYRYSKVAEEPIDGDDRDVGYDLLSIQGLWDRRCPVPNETFASWGALKGNVGGKDAANAPWGQGGFLGSPAPMAFFEPANGIFAQFPSIEPGLPTYVDASFSPGPDDASGGQIDCFPQSAGSGVTATFNNVTAPGTTTATTSNSGAAAPAGFQPGSPGTYYDVSTTASFGGNVELCFDYAESSFALETGIHVFHEEGGSWTDVTTYHGTGENTVCGVVSSFSPFLLAELIPEEDYDTDGCTNAQELAYDEEFGGLRDPLNPWDFYDTNGDKVVDLFIDIFNVANQFGKTPADAGYSTALDRSAAPPGGDAWDMGPPDGTIDLFTDIFGVAFQFGHDCS